MTNSVTSEGTWTVTGRPGRAFAIRSPVGYETIKAALDDRIIIDGTLYRITGVEHFPTRKDIVLGELIGVLVEEVSDEAAH